MWKHVKPPYCNFSWKSLVPLQLDQLKLKITCNKAAVKEEHKSHFELTCIIDILTFQETYSLSLVSILEKIDHVIMVLHHSQCLLGYSCGHMAILMHFLCMATRPPYYFLGLTGPNYRKMLLSDLQEIFVQISHTYGFQILYITYSS